jgi:glycosyltransferase involved in cell wall biosynthesis
MEIIEWLAKAKFYYYRRIKQTNYDLIHIFFGIPTGLLCVPRPKCPYIVSLRGSDVPGDNARFALDYKIFGPVLKTIWKNASGLVACSEGLKQRGRRFFQQAEIDVISNGVESDIFSPASHPRQQGRWRLITVGRLSVTKRIDILIDAVELLKKQGYDIIFTIAGGGSGLPLVERLVAERNIGGIINVLGRVPNEQMADLYRKNDIFISATMQEGMSNAMLEAMASGLPIVTTRCEGLEELIRDNGIIVENATAVDLAMSIKAIIDNPKTYQQMKTAARTRAEQFSWSAVAQAYLQYYRNIIEKK